MVFQDGAHYSAVWSSRTGAAIWCPEGADAICWNKEGDKLVVFIGERSRIDFYSWPERELTGRFSESDPIGIAGTGDMITKFEVSPDERFVAFADVLQGDADISVVELLSGSNSFQEVYRASNGKWNHFIEGPVFSPSGEHAVASVGGGPTWWADGPGLFADDSTPSHGGKFAVGELLIWTRNTPNGLRVPVSASVEKGWRPINPEYFWSYWSVSEPVFLSDNRFKILLPTGHWCTYDTTGTPIGNPEFDATIEIASYYTWQPVRLL